MKVDQPLEQKRKVTISSVLLSILGVMLILQSVALFQYSISGGLVLLIIGLVVFPLSVRLIKKHLHIKFRPWLRVVIVICGIVILGFIAQQQEKPPVAMVATSNENGMIALIIQENPVSFVLRDSVTGEPLEGVSVAISYDPKEPWHALLAIADNVKEYPLQLVQLSGIEGNAYGIGQAGDLFQNYEPIDLPVRPGDEPLLSGIMPTVPTPALASPPPHTPEDLSQALPDVLEKLASLPTVSERFNEQSHFQITTKRVDATDMARQIVYDFDEAMSIKGQAGERVIEWVAERVTNLPVPGMLNQFINANAELVFTKMGATEYDIITLEAGPFHFKIYKPIFPEGIDLVFPENPEAPLHVEATDPWDKSLSGGSFELISKDTMGVGIVGVLDTQGKADIPVFIGDYAMTVQSHGSKPQTVDLKVPKEGASIRVPLKQQKLVSLEIQVEPPLQPRGFLKPGTMLQLRLVGKDAYGNKLSAEQMSKLRCNYFTNNPLGNLVATIQQGDLLRVGPDQGAARITARCNGVNSKPLLVSGKGKEKEKPEESEEPEEPVEPYRPPEPTQPLPAGFPANLPYGDYAISMQICATGVGCMSQNVGTLQNKDTYLFAQQLTSVLEQWAAQVNAGGDCRVSVSYTPFNGESFTAHAGGTCRSGQAVGNLAMDFRVTRI